MQSRDLGTHLGPEIGVEIFQLGLSKRKSFGLRTIALPIATRCRWPPESCRGLRSRSSSIWRTRAASLTRGSISDFGIRDIFEAKSDVVTDRHVRKQRVGLEDHRHLSGGGRDIRYVATIDLDHTACHFLEAGDRAQQG